MTHSQASHLTNRTVIRIGGSDRVAFLQGLISNDVMKVTQTTAIYAALLTPQGKFLHDMFVLEQAGSFLIDCEAARAEDLVQRLTAYKLRSKVTFENLVDAYDVWAIWGGAHRAPLSFPDPRLPALGIRVFTAKGFAPAHVEIADFASYDKHRLSLGVADGSRDMEVGASTLAEGNFDYLNGVDWKKGCYVGQELTARMHYRGLAKKRLFPVRLSGENNAESTITSQGNEIGHLRSHTGEIGIALLALEAVNQKLPLTCGNCQIIPLPPDWMKIDAKPLNS